MTRRNKFSLSNRLISIFRLGSLPLLISEFFRQAVFIDFRVKAADKCEAKNMKLHETLENFN